MAHEQWIGDLWEFGGRADGCSNPCSHRAYQRRVRSLRDKKIMMYRATSQGNVLLTAAEEAAVLAEQAANAPTLAQTKTGALIKIDADTDAIYSDVVGSREQEYALAEQH